MATCTAVQACCGRAPCCPGVTLPNDLDAVVTSTCAPLNGTVPLHKTSNDPVTWFGRVPISGCHGCTFLEVTLVCQQAFTGTGTAVVYHWSIGWDVVRDDGVVCVVGSGDTPATIVSTCGPPLHVTYSASGLSLSDPSPFFTCCSGFSITIDVLGPPP